MKRPDWAQWSKVKALGERKAVWAGLVVVALAGGTVLGSITHQGGSPLPESVAPSQPATAAPAAPPSATADQASRVIVPSIGADAPVVSEGSTGANGGELDVPSDVHTVGWWNGTWKSPSGTVQEKVAAPGQPGVALLAGHVDSAAQGPGVFYRLAQIKPGATITVIDQSKQATHWTVTRVQTVDKSSLPTELFSDTGNPQLALVSCGGPFDDTTGHYVDNIIAWAVPVSS